MDVKYLDDVNNKRVETSKNRIVHAIKLIDNPIGNLVEGRVIDNAVKDIAHAVNLLETAGQEMKWACQHFDWNDEVCMLIDDACAKLGTCLASLLDKNDENYDPIMMSYDGKDALSMLGKALATLIRWNDDDVDIGEV